MQTHFRSIVAMMVFIFTSSVLGAPTRTEDACSRVQSSSFELNRIVQRLSVETSKGMKDVTYISSTIPWIENQDKCDPESLRDNPKHCIKKMAAVLRSYHSAVEMVGKLQDCSEFTRHEMHKIIHAMRQFYTDMRTCVAATRQLHLPEFSVATVHQSEDDYDDTWEAAEVCNYIVNRLSSFSVLSARVFALGDPAKHGHSVAGQCM